MRKKFLVVSFAIMLALAEPVFNTANLGFAIARETDDDGSGDIGNDGDDDYIDGDDFYDGDVSDDYDNSDDNDSTDADDSDEDGDTDTGADSEYKSDITVTNSKELKKAISSAYDNASKKSPCTINVSGGTYSISYLSIPSYTTVVLDKAAILKGTSVSIGSDSCLSGGKLQKGKIDARSSKNIKIDGVTMTSSKGIELKGVSGECNITGNIVKCAKGTAHGLFISSCNIKGNIADNEFSDASGEVLSIASSTIKGDVSGNTIEDGAQAGIYLYNKTKLNGDIRKNKVLRVKGNGIAVYHNSYAGKIDGNFLDTIGGLRSKFAGDYGIAINSNEKKGGVAGKSYVKAITNNTIKNVTYSGIVIFSGPDQSSSKKWQDFAHVKGDISGNKFYNCGCYKASKDWKKEIAEGGKMGGLHAIYVDTHARVYGSIKNNSIEKTGANGIYIRLYSRVKNITGNTIINCKSNGILINKSAQVYGSISRNNIKKTGSNGILIDENGKVKSVKGNKFSKIGTKNILTGNGGKIG